MSSLPPIVGGEIGTSGLRHHSGYLQEEFDWKLRGRRGVEFYREMRDNSAIVGGSLNAIEIVIRQVCWEVVPASSSAEDVERAEFVEGCLHDMSFGWAETVAEHLTMLPQGYAPHEIVYKRRQGFREDGTSSRYNDKRIGWAKIPLRGQETVVRWDLDANGGIHGFWQSAQPDFRERYIPIAKALLFRVRRERNNPEGRSLLRSAAWDYYCAKRLTEIMLIGAERDLAGFPVVRVPAKLMTDPENSAAFQAYKAMARDIRRGEQEGVILPSDRPDGGQHYHYDLQLLTSGGKREFNVPEMVATHTRMMATVLLTDLLLMGHEKVGSYALASTKGGLFETSLDGYCSIIEEIYNTHAIPRLLRLNGWPAEAAPKLCHKPVAPENLAALADFLSKLVAAKLITPDSELEAEIRRRADLAQLAKGVVPVSEREPEPAPAPPAADPEDPEDAEDEEEAAADMADRLQDGRPAMRVHEVAAAIGYSRRYVQKLMSAGALATVPSPSGRERRVPVAEVRRLRTEIRAAEDRLPVVTPAASGAAAGA
jgi:hypothetical protein